MYLAKSVPQVRDKPNKYQRCGHSGPNISAGRRFGAERLTR